MKLYVVALLALAGLTLADDATPRVCTVTLDEDEEMHEKMAKMALRCLVTDMGMIERIKGLETMEDHKTLFKDSYCDKKETIRECLAGVVETSKVCESEIRHKFLLLFGKLLENVLDSGCIEDGEIIAAIFHNYNFSETPSYKLDGFHDCMNTALVRIVHLMDKHIEPFSRLFILYREILSSKECFNGIDEGDVSLTKKIASVLEDISNKMKCLHPVAEITVLCKALDVNIPDVPRICPIKMLDETKRTLKDGILEGMSWCLTSTFLDEGDLNTIDTLERSWQFFVHNCEKKNEISKCLSEVTTLSSVCLDEKHHNTVKLFNAVLHNGLDSLCITDGGHSGGYVVYKALSTPNATVRHNVITDCMDIVHRDHEASKIHIDAANFLNLHHELKAFKGCLLNKMKGDNRAVFDVHLFLSSVERHMKCLDPEHGTMVLCDTMDSTLPTGPTECPFVGTHGNERPKYGRFVDMAIDCLKSSRMEIDPIRKFTTLDQFQTFFHSFCHNHRDVKLCFDDITAYSRVCLDQINQNMLTTATDVFGEALESGCNPDGEIFSTIMNGLLVDASELRDTCVNETADEIRDRNPSPDNVSETSTFHYRLFVSTYECILKGTSDEGTFKTAFSTLTNQLRKNFKCIDTDDVTLVLCETLVHN